MLVWTIDGMTGREYQIPLKPEVLLPSYLEALEFTKDYLMGEDEDEDEDYYPEYAPETLETVKETIAGFLNACPKDELAKCGTVEKIGHNLYLSSVGHGAGFFDDGLHGLQDCALHFNLGFYIGDDSLIYCN